MRLWTSSQRNRRSPRRRGIRHRAQNSRPASKSNETARGRDAQPASSWRAMMGRAGERNGKKR